jgi:hypothetical protein
MSDSSDLPPAIPPSPREVGQTPEEIRKRPATPAEIRAMWIIVLCVISGIIAICSGCFVAMYYGGTVMLHNHPTIRPVIEKLNTDTRVEKLLGKPLEIGYLDETAQITNGKYDGSAKFTLPVRGPLGEGGVHVQASMKDPRVMTNPKDPLWTFDEMTLQIKGQVDMIDLLDPDEQTVEPLLHVAPAATSQK